MTKAWPDEATLSKNLELAARRALDDPEQSCKDAQWYSEQSKWLKSVLRPYSDSMRGAERISKAAAITAVLSPQVSWDSQRHFLPEVIRKLMVGVKDIRRLRHPGFDANKRKARAIASGEDIALVNKRGPKVLAFYSNLLGDYEPVTVDSQITDLAVGCLPSDRPGLTLRRYRQIEGIIQTLAATLSGGKWKPAELQAILWCWHRRNK